jgi:hypothetical protein
MDTSANTRELLLASCRVGVPVPAIQQITTAGRITRTTYRAAFTEACVFGQLLIAQWLLTICSFTTWQTLFGEMISANRSNLATISWVYEQSLSTENPIDIQFCQNEYFFIAVCNNALDVVQWLYTIVEATGKQFSMCEFEHLYFKTCIERNYSDMLKWLSSKKSIMHNLDLCEELVKLARSTRHYEMFYAIIEINKLNEHGFMYDIAHLAIHKNDLRMFRWVLRCNTHIYIEQDQHYIMQFCIFNNMRDFVMEMIHCYSIYYTYVIVHETGLMRINAMNPYIECMKRQLYDKAISILQLRKGDGTKAIDCGICMKQSTDVDDVSPPYVVTTGCKHSFCLPCFINWNENHISRHTCALCRSVVKYDQVTYFENSSCIRENDKMQE